MAREGTVNFISCRRERSTSTDFFVSQWKSIHGYTIFGKDFSKGD